ncbi:hypothetical protein LAZ67_2004244 [Cordylochernes scorpioides]|uniref:Uncharacterized protein n=1 Tax=Cordylochernes scorpioides TaxID=51811 RepID=A0ABY6K5A9_9ARAC|nr:hypothetical protein LAZ67_2004244 [Cordylochernes scorpioides]
MEDASMGEQEKLLRLPNYLVRQPLELFRKLRLADRSYFQVRQILLDLYPESSEASFAKYFAMKLTGQANLETYYREKTAMGLQLGLPQEVILETLTEGLPFNDQRLVRVVPPENLGEWFRLVQRIHGPSVPATRSREDQPPTMSGPYHSTPRRPDTLTAETVVELTSICLGMSTFTFDTQFFKQTKGSPMGSPLSTVVAEVVMRSLDQWITSRHSSDIFLWRRYIDDTFCLNKRRETLTKGVRFHHDNARPHTAHQTTALIEEFEWELVSHPPHVAPSDFHLFPELKKNLGGTQFQDDDELEEAVLGFYAARRQSSLTLGSISLHKTLLLFCAIIMFVNKIVQNR